MKVRQPLRNRKLTREEFLKDIEDAPGNLDYDEDELDDIMEYFDAYL